MYVAGIDKAELSEYGANGKIAQKFSYIAGVFKLIFCLKV